MSIDKKNIQKITAQIVRRFPEMAGCTPIVQQQKSAQAKSLASDSTYVLTYQGSARLAEGKTLPRHVRVVVDGQGNILRISTSR